MTSTDVQAMIIKLDGITAKLKEIRDFAEDTNNIDPEIQKQVGQNLADIVKDTIKWTDRAIKTAEDHRDKLAKK